MNADLLIIQSMEIQDSKMEEFFSIEQIRFIKLENEFDYVKKHTLLCPEIISLYQDLVNGVADYFDEYLLSLDLDKKADILTKTSFLIHILRKKLEEIIY